MIRNVRRVPFTALLLAAVVVTVGCGSDDNALPTAADTDDSGMQAELTETTGDGTAGDGDGSDTVDNTDADANPDTATVVSTEQEAIYTARFVAIWSAETHPINFPADPHFSPLTGAVHSEQVVIWESGQNATDGIEEMAETGGTAPLLVEIQAAIDEGRALSRIEGGGIPESPGATEVEFTVSRDYPLVTLVSMLAPSPDWFIGVNSLQMLDQNGGFVDSVTIELNLYDSGTDGGLRFNSPDQDIPRSPIGLVNSFPSDSNFLDGQPSVGSLIITRQ